ncbi:hypothetical protein NFJ02_43g111150 [Pycnococcus provasolii]
MPADFSDGAGAKVPDTLEEAEDAQAAIVSDGYAKGFGYGLAKGGAVQAYGQGASRAFAAGAEAGFYEQLVTKGAHAAANWDVSAASKQAFERFARSVDALRVLGVDDDLFFPKLFESRRRYDALVRAVAGGAAEELRIWPKHAADSLGPVDAPGDDLF